MDDSGSAVIPEACAIEPPRGFVDVADLNTRNWQHYYRDIFSQAYLEEVLPRENLKMWQERYERLPATGDFFRVARQAGKLVGFTYASSQPAGEDGIRLDYLHVDPLCHGRGIGRALMAAAARWIEPTGRPLFLEVFAANRYAAEFYRRCGGAKIREFTEDLADGGKTLTFVYQWRDTGVLFSGSPSRPKIQL